MTKGVGHALLITAYNQENKGFTFFDPALGEINESQFESEYKMSFQQAWLNQPNLFIPPGAMVTITR